MSETYKLSRKLVARGCPEHPRLFWDRNNRGRYPHFGSHDHLDSPIMSASDERAIWTMWALEWYISLGAGRTIQVCSEGTLTTTTHTVLVGCNSETDGWQGAPTILEAIEAATRHLEPADVQRS